MEFKSKGSGVRARYGQCERRISRVGSCKLLVATIRADLVSVRPGLTPFGVAIACRGAVPSVPQRA